MNIFKIRPILGVFISLLIISVLALLSLSAIKNFSAYKKVLNQELSLNSDIFRFFLKNELKYEYTKLTAPKPLKDEASQLKTFHFTVDEKDLQSLNANLPKSGKDHYIKAYMKVSDKKDKIYKVKLRYRGDNYYHWLYKQKSLRIKLDKNDVYHMVKAFNLINPTMYLQILDKISYQIASEIGIISPRYYFARVFINNIYMGVQIYLDQADESLLRRHHIMPGSIYYGEASPINKDGIADLTFDAKHWQKKASRNKEQEKITEDIEYFIKATNSFDAKKFYDFKNTFIDDKYLSFIAIDRFTGSHHHDYTHNHKIYFDPYKGKYQPIEWDIRFWQDSNIKDESLYPLVLKLTQNPIFDAQIDKILYSIIKKYPIQKIKQEYQTILDRVSPDLKADIYKDTTKIYPKLLPPPYWYSVELDEKELKPNMQADIQKLSNRINYLKKLLDEVKVEYFIKDNFIYFNISGNSPVQLTFQNKTNLIKKVYKSKLYDINKTEVLYAGRVLVKNAQTKYPKLMMGTDAIKSTNLLYKFKLDASLDATSYLKSIKFKNFITQKPLKISKSPKIFKDSLSIHPWSFIKTKKTKILQGEIQVNKTMIFDRYTDVVIKPNTTFVMSPKTSIYFYSKVTAIGTKQKPIRFIAKDKTKPWGLVALQGQATSGSVFEYCKFSDGSTDIRNLIHYTAQFNIHDTSNFLVKNSTIDKNHIGDDAMHIAYASGTVDSSIFKNARSDGLDIDISDVIVKNSTFIDSGNDGLDIMTTKIKASANLFINSGDKGFSIGEASDVNITDSVFISTLTGIEIKDDSKVLADNLVFADSKKVAINLYNKNKRYNAGGFLKAKNIYLLGNSKIQKDKKSKYGIKNIIELKK